MKTLRLDYPCWQGGNHPDYFFSANILKHIVPYTNVETIEIPVLTDFNKKLENEYGIMGQNTLFQQYNLIKEILEDRQPDEVIVVGGDCSVSQQPFEYMSERYGSNFGILWLDAHGDVATVENSQCNHDMVLNNLITGDGSALAKMVQHPVNPNHVMLAGLVYNKLRPQDENVNIKELNYITPERLHQNTQEIIQWIKHNRIAHLAIHFDLDVLDPQDFRSIFPAKPHLDSLDDVVGELTLEDVGLILKDVSTMTHVCALTIAEHMPWDAIRLHNMLENVSLFKKR